MALPHPTWLHTFEVAARHSSFAAAAKELNLTAAAVSQQIRLLEQTLGVQLFQRLPRGVALTDIGTAYAQPVRRSFSDLEMATNDLFGAKKRKVVKVRASISAAALVIAPRLAEFQAQHPDISVELSTFVWADGFDMAEHDVDIRWGHGDWREHSIQPLANESAIVVCHPDAASTDIHRVAASRIYQVTGRESDWRDLSDHFGLGLDLTGETITVDSSMLAIMALTTSPGTTIVLESFAGHHLKTGQLVAPFPYRLPVAPSHFLVHQDGAQNRTEVAAFSAWVHQIYSDDA